MSHWEMLSLNPLPQAEKQEIIDAVSALSSLLYLRDKETGRCALFFEDNSENRETMRKCFEALVTKDA